MEHVIPKLRFPEFEGNWEEKSFNSLYTFKSTNSFSRDNLNYEHGEVKNIHYGDIHTKFSTLFDITKEKVPFINLTIDTSKIKEDSYIEEGDLIIADASENYDDIGKMIEVVNVNDEKLVAGLHTFLAKRKNTNNAIGFTANLVKTWNVRQQILKIAQGTKVLSISTGRLGEILLTIPQPEEQQKIASFLTSVDERLTLLAQQKEKLELYKKGVMQQIFSQKLRFKDENGNEYPDWEEKKLGEIGFFQTSSIDKLTKDDEKKVFLVNYMNVYRHEDINNETVKSFQIVSAKESQIESCNLKKGDILFTPSSETPDDIGRSVVIFEDLENSVFSYHLMRFRPTIEINILYSHYFCNVPNVLKQLSKYATGSTRFTISVGNFSKVKVQIPHLEEQQKIASFLSAIDFQIEGVSKKIKQTKLFKKGLLQQMFV